MYIVLLWIGGGVHVYIPRAKALTYVAPPKKPTITQSGYIVQLVLIHPRRKWCGLRLGLGVNYGRYVANKQVSKQFIALIKITCET